MKKAKKTYSLLILNKSNIISKEIILFSYSLIKNIFIVHNNTEKTNNKKLDEWITKINGTIIKSESKFINKDYSLKNLKNIIFFIKNQNLKFYADIIETILIYIFSKVFETERDNSFYKYIFNNLNKINDLKNKDLTNWVKRDKLIPEELKNLDILFNYDDYENVNLKEKTQKSVFYNFILEILKNKYNLEFTNYEKNKKNLQFINLGNYDAYDLSNYIYKKLKENNCDVVAEKDFLLNSIMNLNNNLSKPLSKNNKPILPIIRSFFTQVYIFYQNKNSPLKKYSIKDEKNENYAVIPFAYDLRGACIDCRFSHIVLSPLRCENFISKILLRQNNIRECGLYELGKISVFNDSVKLIECDKDIFKTSYLFFLTNSMGVFENFSVEEINFLNNNIKSDGEEFLIKVIKKFKSLKTLNISGNEMKNGLSNFFIVLKKLYREKKSKLENLILNKCNLDYSSLNELGELVKCKYCKLKKLCMNNNIIAENSNFFKNLKSNKSLKEIYMNKCCINDTFIDNILKIISHSNIRYFYLSKNKLNNFNDFLRILYRTKIIQKKENKNKKKILLNEDITLINLDLSNNEYSIKNNFQIEILKNILEQTGLFCLDICHILYGAFPDKYKDMNENRNYKSSVNEIKSYLEKIKSRYGVIIKEMRINNVDISRLKYIKNDKILKKYDKREFDTILENKLSIYPVFLKSEIEKLINDDDKTEENMNKLVDYLNLKRSENNLEKLEKEKYNKKLIII